MIRVTLTVLIAWIGLSLALVLIMVLVSGLHALSNRLKAAQRGLKSRRRRAGGAGA